ncbi:putative uncharacterized protein [Mycoplasma sp. CAG:956]|nr:putative uncharacterized protein [Mycoplasma sp. CAG:956]
MKKTFKMLWGLVLFLLCVEVEAAKGPTIDSVENKDNDLIYVQATKGDFNISYYLMGTSISNAIKYVSSSTNAYLSMPNGTYTIWAVDTNGNTSAGYTITKDDGSCNMDGLSNVTGSGTIDMCGIMSSTGLYSNLTEGKTLVTCAPGYYLHTIQTEPISTTCRLSSLDFTPYGLQKRLCKNTYNYRCEKNTGNIVLNASSYLNSLSLSRGSISPAFDKTKFDYTATVSSSTSVVTVYASLLDSDASFVDGYEPRTVNLNYGENTIQIKVKGFALQEATESTYTIKITRTKSSGTGGATVSKSSVNTLSNITLSNGSLSPKFNSNTNVYNVEVENDVDVLTVGATLTDNKSSFVNSYGPRNVHLNEGENNVYLKVKSEAGSVRVYRLIITRKKANNVEPEPTPTPDPTPEPTPEVSKALLSSLKLSEGKIDFESNVFDYNVTVGYDVTNVVATVELENDTDTVDIKGGESLEVGANELTITVTSSDGSVSNVYTIYIIKKEADTDISGNSLLKSLVINGHAINFDPNVNEYNITIKKNETDVGIECVPDDSNASVTIEGNANLTTGSQIKIRVTAENGNYTDYLINVTGYQKKSNIIGTIFIVLLVILAVAYAILRALGYKIYFNLQGIKNFFSNLFNGIFTRK